MNTFNLLVIIWFAVGFVNYLVTLLAFYRYRFIAAIKKELTRPAFAVMHFALLAWLVACGPLTAWYTSHKFYLLRQEIREEELDR